MTVCAGRIVDRQIVLASVLHSPLAKGFSQIRRPFFGLLFRPATPPIADRMKALSRSNSGLELQKIGAFGAKLSCSSLRQFGQFLGPFWLSFRHIDPWQLPLSRQVPNDLRIVAFKERLLHRG